jgi:hypothetical protein
VLSHRDVQVSISLHLTGESSEYTLTSAQPLGSRPPVLNSPTQQISISLRLTRESSGVSHHLNSLHRGEQYIVSSPSQRERHAQLMGFLTPQRGTQRSIFVSERNHTPISWAHPTHGLPHPTQGHTTFLLRLREEQHTQLMGSLSGRLTQSVSWRISHAVVIINNKYSGLIAQLNLVIDSEPSTLDEVAKHKMWKDAMIEEYESILKNDVWEVVPRPQGKSVVTSKWVYKIKHAADGSVEKFKARFVARGFSHKEGIDYDEIFGLVARYTSIRIIISLASVFNWKLHQMDVKT